jgi:2-oxoglutarate dehydrogenase E2 component (dihydrolipoamide succinyltransferase)
LSKVIVPEIGESVVEATVGNWLKNVGDMVSAGEALVELETDKVNLEITANESGQVISIDKASGEIVAVGDVLAEITPMSQTEPVLPAPQAAPADTPVVATEPSSTVRATPDVRRLAREHGVDVGRVPTSNKGRVTHEDVAAYVQSSRPSAPISQPTPSTVVPFQKSITEPGQRPQERVRMSRRRLTIAHRLVEAQHTAAMLTTFNEVDMSAILDLRRRRKDSFFEKHGVRLGFMSFFTKASIAALKTMPRLNAEIQGDEMILKRYYDIGVAVSTEAGLVVPVVRDADRLNFSQLEKHIAELAQKARDNTLSLDDLQGGTFTITNGGVFGSLLSTPILNAPQVAILGMHKIEERPVAINGQVVVRPMMYLALSYDHRIVDGSEAVRFLVSIKELLEDPEALLLES